MLIIIGGLSMPEVRAEEFSAEQDSVSSSDRFSPQEHSAGPPAEESSREPSAERLSQEPPAVSGNDSSVYPSAPVPIFRAWIEYTFQGYVVKGSLDEFPPDVNAVRILYSLDGETYIAGADNWRVYRPDSDSIQVKNGKQICLYGSQEPFRSYLAGETDHFYLKLSLTGENGAVSETQAVIIDRGVPQSIPEECGVSAWFESSIRCRGSKQGEYGGRYQLTVSRDATLEEIQAYLPDTLPVEVQIYPPRGPESTENTAIGIVDYPVTWKSFALPGLAAGESVTISDAVEDIVLPAGTEVNTPLGIFRLEEPLDVAMDKVTLILNVVAEDGAPTGVLCSNRAGLEVAFDLKPTGAAAIHAYIFTENQTEWVKLPDLVLSEVVDATPSAASSGYTTVLPSTAAPYLAYLEAKAAQREPVPFYIGLEIEGGVYNGRELILAWPDTYDLPPHLPRMGGAGGNEGNAGTDNRGDSTEEGQRPHLPQTSQNTGDTGDMEYGGSAENKENAEDKENVENKENAENKEDAGNIGSTGEEREPFPPQESGETGNTGEEQPQPTEPIQTQTSNETADTGNPGNAGDEGNIGDKEGTGDKKAVGDKNTAGDKGNPGKAEVTGEAEEKQSSGKPLPPVKTVSPAKPQDEAAVSRSTLSVAPDSSGGISNLVRDKQGSRQKLLILVSIAAIAGVSIAVAGRIIANKTTEHKKGVF